MDGRNDELHDLSNRMVDRTTAYGMEVGTETCKIMANSLNNIGANISTNGKNLEEVTTFKYLGATLCSEGTCSAEFRIKIA